MNQVSSNSKPNQKLAESLAGLAEGLQKDIDGKFASRVQNTPRQQAAADKARLDGYHLQRAQKAFRTLSDLHRAGCVPAELMDATSKKKVLELTRSKIDRTGEYYDAGTDTGLPAVDSAATRALWQLIDGDSVVDQAAEDLRKLLNGLKFAKIPGYFPTPAPVIELMLNLARIPEEQHVSILEPEGGSGAILDAVKASFPLASLTTYEIRHSLREVLELKGYELEGDDFLDAKPDELFDHVLMNPPFENGQDIEHVRHAYQMLKPGGRLVAIMCPGPFFRTDRKSVEFREWLDEVSGDQQKLPDGSFKESGTGVSAHLVTIDHL